MEEKNLFPVEAELLKIERALSDLRGFDGWMIGKCRASLHLLLEKGRGREQSLRSGHYAAEIIKRGSASAVIRVEESKDGLLPPQEPGSQMNFLQVLLVNPRVRNGARSIGVARSERQIERQKENQRREEAEGRFSEPVCFSAVQTENFLELSADRNPIHRGKGAIVPGFLILNRIAAYCLKAHRGNAGWGSCRLDIEAKFLSPLPVGETAALESVCEKEGSVCCRLDTSARKTAVKMEVTIR